MVNILLIDNYDSFTYNLVHLCHEVLREHIGSTGTIHVSRPDAITLNAIEAMSPQAIMISPGPGTPAEAPFSKSVIQQFAGRIPLFGVCLGMQAMAECFGAQVKRGTPIHGKLSGVRHDQTHPLFLGIPNPFDVVRYHSLQVATESVHNANINPIAWTDDHVIMALESTTKPMVWGVQFHPESIGSDYGKVLLGNFYKAASRFNVELKVSSSNSSFSKQ